MDRRRVRGACALLAVSGLTVGCAVSRQSPRLVGRTPVRAALAWRTIAPTLSPLPVEAAAQFIVRVGPAPTVTITGPTTDPTYDNGTTSTITTIAGTAAIAGSSISACTWVNNLGGSGTATGTISWAIASITLTEGSNRITVQCQTALGNTTTDVITVTYAPALPGDNPIAAARLPGGDATVPNPIWASAGVTGGIPTDRTQCGSTLASGSTIAQINSAITACTSGHYVLLGPGTFSGSGSIDLNKSGVTLRGSGANQTRLVMSSGNSGCGLGFISMAIRACAQGVNIGGGGINAARNTATCTASTLTQGSTLITCSSTTNLTVGSTIWLDQQDDTTDGYPAAGDLYVCAGGPPCIAEDGNDWMRAGRYQAEAHKVTAIEAACGSSCDITLDSPIIAPNFRSAKNPGAWWGNMPGTSPTDVLTGVGLEDFELQFTQGTFIAGIGLINLTDSWLQGVSLVKTGASGSFNLHAYIINGHHLTIDQNYFYGPETGTNPITNYALALYSQTSVLVTNNIFHHNPSPIEIAGVDMASVFAYNHTFDNWFAVGGIQDHAFNMYTLSEGNNWGVRFSDVNHGNHFFNTLYRDSYSGEGENGDTQTAIGLIAHSRFYNILANVATGTSYTTYESMACGTAGSCGDTSIYVGGWPSNCGACGTLAFDSHVQRTLYRRFNWDAVTAGANKNVNGDQTGTRTTASEVPTTITNYPQAVPANTYLTLPASLFQSTKPALLGSLPWPLIGPDVSGGNITNTGGHANKGPAQLCFEAAAATLDADYPTSSPRVRSGVASACAVP